MAKVTVVGSGASGVHFAQAVLEKGHEVTLIDIGLDRSQPPLPTASLSGLKEQLDDPAEYFLGSDFRGVLLPTADSEYYGIPPSKSYVFEQPAGFDFSASGFAPLFSFARGGLGEVWTGGCYPFNREETAEMPIDFDQLLEHYGKVAGHIGVTGEEDDLARFMPLHGNLLEPLRLDAHSRLLVELYERRSQGMNRALGCYLGRTRVATLSRDLDGRQACSYTGRCLWGCPNDAIYTPSQTLKRCLGHPGFQYLSGRRVDFFRIGGANRVCSIVASNLNTGEAEEIPVETLALAAGTLSSSKILLRSIYEERGEVVRLPGLMDNRQVLLPFVNHRMLGEQFSDESYQYHLLGMGLEMERPTEYVHCQITTLKTALMHPIVQKLPLDLSTSNRIARTLHAALGVVNVNFHDTPRPSSYLTLRFDDDSEPQLALHYEPPANEQARVKSVLKRIKRALLRLGCIVPPGMLHVRPMGASVHYAGTVPMREEPQPLTTTSEGQSHDFENLYFVDGATFPSLPAKNLTFTLMANASRIAANAF